MPSFPHCFDAAGREFEFVGARGRRASVRGSRDLLPRRSRRLRGFGSAPPRALVRNGRRQGASNVCGT